MTLRRVLLYSSSRRTFRAGGIVGEGDSIMRGFGLATPTTQNWFALTCAALVALGVGYNFAAYNGGTDSDTIANMLPVVNAEVIARKTNGRICPPHLARDLAVLDAGSNDGYFGGAEATARSNQIAWLAAVRAAGFRAIYCSILPRLGSAPGTFPAFRTANNAFWTANWATHADGYVDFGALAGMQDPTDATKYRQGVGGDDQTHPTALGHTLMRDAAIPVFRAVCE